MNTGNMCLASAVLQVLVHSLPFWNLFRKLGYLNGQHGAGLRLVMVDATMMFFSGIGLVVFSSTNNLTL